MTRWEYKTIKFVAGGWWAGGKIDERSLELKLNQLGRDGWELVSVVVASKQTGASRDIVAIFKRVEVECIPDKDERLTKRHVERGIVADRPRE
jgi:hypothetical protein